MICQLANDIIIQFYATDRSKPLLHFLIFPSVFLPLPPLMWQSNRGGEERKGSATEFTKHSFFFSSKAKPYQIFYIKLFHHWGKKQNRKVAQHFCLQFQKQRLRIPFLVCPQCLWQSLSVLWAEILILNTSNFLKVRALVTDLIKPGLVYLFGAGLH